MKNTYKELSDFVKAEVLLNMLMIFSMALIGPVLIKVQGITFTVTMIGALSMLSRMNILISLLLKDIDMYKKHLLIIILAIIDFIVLVSFDYMSHTVFMVLITTSGMLVGVAMTSFYIDYDVILADMLDKRDLRNLQYIERIAFGVAGVLGTGCAMLLGDLDVGSIIKIGSIIFFLVILVIIKQHIVYYSTITIDNYKHIVK